MAKKKPLQDGDGSDHGDLVDPSRDSEVRDEAEPADQYPTGLYYPVSIGEVLVERYRIRHKLGWGGFSTVWMAYDMHIQKNVALKIMTAGEKGEVEYEMNKEILRTVNDTSHLVTYQDSFVLVGFDSKRHRVLVLPLRGPSLTYRTVDFPIATRVSGAKQLLMALKELHDAGLVHRDLNEGAMMWDMTSGAEYSKATIYEKLGRPQKLRLEDYGYELWKHGEYVVPVNPPLESFGSTMYLGDFGLTIKEGTPVHTKVQGPYNYCAPERAHGEDPSRASDMWSYMCLFCSLYLGYTVFYGSGKWLGNCWFSELGPMPERWKGKYWWEGVADDKWYEQASVAEPMTGLEETIARDRPDVSEAERKLVLSVMLKGFCYLPEHRITAGQLLDDPSFKALMDIYQC